VRKELLQFLLGTHELYINKLVTQEEKIQNRRVTYVRKYNEIQGEREASVCLRDRSRCLESWFGAGC